MDPALRRLLAQPVADDSAEVEAIVRLRDPRARIPGVRLVARFGHIATCRISRRQLLEAYADEALVSLKAPRLLGPDLVGTERSVAGRRNPPDDTDADVRRPPMLPFTGAGVVVGVVDWGCDVDAPSFRRPQDGSTRLLGLWDQRGGPGPGAPRPYGYGVHHRPSRINTALRSGQPYATLGYHPADADRGGSGAHGTHVLDIAAGNGGGGGPVGIAPEADLVFVHLADQGTSGLANLGDSVRLLEAVDFIVRIAGRRPWVINISVGRHGGPHDGSTLVELALDELLAAGRGRAIVQSAGNYFVAGTHSAGRLWPGRPTTLTFTTDPADLTSNELELWYSGQDEIAVRLQSPSGAATPLIGLGTSVAVFEGPDRVGRLYHRERDPNNLDNHVDLFLDPAAPDGVWTLVLEPRRLRDGRYHAWLERDEACGPCQARFIDSDRDRSTTTGTIANGHLPLVVGAYDAFSPHRPVASFCSAGPTRDQRAKPDISASGVGVLAARSAPGGSASSPGGMVRKSGTSMAAPHVAGAVALVLEAGGSQISMPEIRALVLGTARRPPGDGPPDPRLGFGYLDLAALSRRLERHWDNKEAIMHRDLNRSALDALGPDQIYRELVYPPTAGGARIDEAYTVLALPGEQPRSQPRAGDVMVCVALGEPGFGKFAMLRDPKLVPHSSIPRGGARSAGRGFYVGVVETGPATHRRDGTVVRRLLDETGRMPLGQLLLRPRGRPEFEPADGGDGEEAITCGEARSQARGHDEPSTRLIAMLRRPIRADDTAAIVARANEMTALFRSLDPTQRTALRRHLDDPNDALGTLFRCELDRRFRYRLRRLLDDPASVQPARPSPAQPAVQAGTSCARELGSMTMLRPWERAFLALVHGVDEKDFAAVGLFIGPIILPTMDAVAKAIVPIALKNGYAITIDTNIWFPSRLDTRCEAGLTLLAHESAHVLDYARAGTAAFLQAYVAQAVTAGFDHDDIPLEQRANRFEEVARLLLRRRPDLMAKVATCDNDAILTMLQSNHTTYQADVKTSLAGLPAGEEAEPASEAGDAQLDRLINQGLPENQITNALFYARNPAQSGTTLRAGTRAAREWQTIRDVEVRPAMRQRLVISPVDPVQLAIFLSQYENDSRVPAEYTKRFLTGIPLLSMGRTLRDRVIGKWRSGGRPLTASGLYDMALQMAGDAGIAALLCHNVTKAFVREGVAITWRGTGTEGEYTDGQKTYSAKVINPAGRLKYYHSGKRRDIVSIFYLLFSAKEFGTDDPGDWYHYFVTATMTALASGGTLGATGRGRREDVEGDLEDRGGRVGSTVYRGLVAERVAHLEKQMTDPALASVPGYRGWVLANVLSFLESGHYGADFTTGQSDVVRESKVHVRGAAFGLRTIGGSPGKTWRWYIPVAGSLSDIDLATGFDLKDKTAEVWGPDAKPAAGEAVDSDQAFDQVDDAEDKTPVAAHVKAARVMWTKLFGKDAVLSKVLILDMANVPSEPVKRAGYDAWTNSATRIYVASSANNDNLTLEITLRHEAVHIQQFAKFGRPDSYAKMVKYEIEAYEKIRNRLQTMSDDVKERKRRSQAQNDRLATLLKATRDQLDSLNSAITQAEDGYRDFLLNGDLLPAHQQLRDLYEPPAASKNPVAQESTGWYDAAESPR